MAARETSREWLPLQKQLLPRPKGGGAGEGGYQRNALRRQRRALELALRKGYLRKLDRELILESQLESEGGGDGEAVELSHVRRISLSGCNVQTVDDIAVLSCARLAVCNLASSYVRDISPFYGCLSLQKLDVSNNQIEHLPPHDFWSSLSNLRILYLHGNTLSSREALGWLNGCPVLHILTLHDTPLALTKHYRHHVVNSVFSLRALDYHVISDEEIIENLHLSGCFKSLTPHFNIPLYYQCPKGTPFREEVRGMFTALLTVDRVLAHCSPVTIIQRWVRGWLVRKSLLKSSNPGLRSLVQRKVGSSISRRDQTSKRTISTQVPAPSPGHAPKLSKKRNLRKSHSDSLTASTPPAPPPTSPLHHHPSPRHPAHGHTPKAPLETIILDTDSGSLKVRYSVHINLHKLHHGVREATESYKMEEAVSGLQRKPPQPPPPPPPPPPTGTSTSSPHTRAEGDGVSLMSPLPLARRRDGEIDASRAGAATEGNLGVGEEGDGVGMAVEGRTVEVTSHDFVAGMTVSARENGKSVREAEKEIKEIVSKAKRQQSLSLKEQVGGRKLGRMTKDEFAFARAYSTMALSRLRTVEKKEESRKKADRFVQKADLVSRIKQERLKRREKIEAHRRALRENIGAWRADEEARLEELRERQQMRESEERVQRSDWVDCSAGEAQRRVEDEQFASEFNRQSTLIGATLSEEDRQLARDAEFQEVKEEVSAMREVAGERRELVRRYMELRKSKLLQENICDKHELDTKMLETASLRMIEAKKRVAREVARRQAAKEATAMARGELLPSGDGHGTVALPPILQGAVRMELQTTELDALRRGETERGGVPRAYVFKRTQGNLRRMTKEAHQTWQRGSKVITEREKLKESQKGGPSHFLVIASIDSAPLMYNMLRPGPTLISAINTPDDTRTASSTSDIVGSVSSLLHRGNHDDETTLLQSHRAVTG